MSVKQIGLSCLILAVSGLGVVRAQAPAQLPSGPDVLPLYTPAGNDMAPSYGSMGAAGTSIGPTSASAPAGTTPEGIAIDEGSPPPPPHMPIPLGPPLSPYLNYPRSPCCCGAVGTCGGPIGSELFIRSGFSFPVGSGIFNQFLHTGWDIEGGARVLFFNQPSTRAWTVSLSVSNIFNRTGDANQPITLFRFPVHTLVVSSPTSQQGSASVATPTIVQVPQVTATVSSLNQTFVNLGFGREWWLLGSAYPGSQGGCNWRVGIDGGGRWGTADVQFNEFQHRTDVIGGLFCAIHSDVEWVCRCAIPFAGVRFEYNYIWTSLLQDQNNGNYQSLNLLFQLGVRF